MKSLMGDVCFAILQYAGWAYVPLQIYVILCWRGWYRIVGLLPLLVLVPVLIAACRATGDDFISLLWLIFLTPLGGAYLCILMLNRWLESTLSRLRQIQKWRSL